MRVLIVVENVAAADDHRVSKQIDTLLENGYSVRVITRRHKANERYRGHPLVRMFEYRPPAEPGHLLGYFAEYGYSFAIAAFLAFRIASSERIDVVQFCQPPDIYFPLARMLRRTGARVLVDQRDLLPELYTARYGRTPPGLLAMLRLLERLSQGSADHILGARVGPSGSHLSSGDRAALLGGPAGLQAARRA